MNNKTRMVVGRDSKRKGPKMDRPLGNNCLFREDIVGLMKLFKDKCFVEKLLVLHKIVLEHYDDAAVYLFNLRLNNYLVTCCFIVTVIVMKDDNLEMSKSQISSLICDKINDGSKVPFFINLVEVSDPLEFERYKRGEIGPHKG